MLDFYRTGSCLFCTAFLNEISVWDQEPMPKPLGRMFLIGYWNFIGLHPIYVYHSRLEVNNYINLYFKTYLKTYESIKCNKWGGQWLHLYMGTCTKLTALVTWYISVLFPIHLTYKVYLVQILLFNVGPLHSNAMIFIFCIQSLPISPSKITILSCRFILKFGVVLWWLVASQMC
jgi:hypothetical protein